MKTLTTKLNGMYLGAKTGLLALVAMFIVVGAGQAYSACIPTTWDLLAGQSIPVGTLTVSNDTNNIYVTYAIDTLSQPTATFGTLHLWIGADLALVHNGGLKRPAPGHLSFISGATKNGFSFPSSEGSTSYTFTIPLSAINVTGVSNSTLCPTLPKLYVVAHAEVRSVYDSAEGTFGGETAFAGPVAGAGDSWWFYGQYTICCDFGTPGVCFSGTAFAKGGYVWVTSSKANPEKLPSLMLTQNRWGWAINLKQTGSSVYDIWAGAGLNNTLKGVNVGRLTVNWNGSSATVTYNMNLGYYLEEVHIYASDFAPGSQIYLAPGSFGYPAEGYDMQPGTTSFTYTMDLSESGNDGVWLIAHSVVSNGNCN